MKRLDLVQLTIIIVGLFIGTLIIGYIPQFLFLLFTWLSEGLKGGYYMEAFIQNILVIGMYLLTAIYSIKKSKHFAEWICNNANLNAHINFALDKTALIFVLFTGLGVYGLIKTLPKLLVDLFNRIKSSNNLALFEETKKVTTSDIIIQVITLLLFFTLVYYAKIFADFFAGKINNTEPEDEIAATAELND